ncbi:uncharacterized protein [Gossypium hirsutum]|uniref:Chromo domain-containing protein n=1 Tax=Gossypium hirsutum TaxID=3635 RepID=A0A1U8KNN6_GOSHI|nr:uncharacterized protein LOC107919072 [Gossypium hirsutum]
MEEKRNFGPNLVCEIEDKVKLICERLQVVLDRQKSYTDLRRRDIEYEVGDKCMLAHYVVTLASDHKVFLKVSHWKKVFKFGQKGKLSLRFIGSYEKYRSNPSPVVPVEEVEVRSDISYEEEPIVILDREVKVLCSKTVQLVKVFLCNHKTKEATWESEHILRR